MSDQTGDDMGKKLLSVIRLDLAVVIIIFLVGTVGNYTVLAQVPAQNQKDIRELKEQTSEDLKQVKSDVETLKAGQVRAETAREFMRIDMQRVLTILEGRYTEPRVP